jgi:hypothetical protein
METHVMHAAERLFPFPFQFDDHRVNLLNNFARAAAYIHTILIVGRPVIISRKWVETHVMQNCRSNKMCAAVYLSTIDHCVSLHSQQLHSTGPAYLPTSYRKTSNRVLVNQTANLFIVFITHTTSSVARVIIRCRSNADRCTYMDMGLSFPVEIHI